MTDLLDINAEDTVLEIALVLAIRRHPRAAAVRCIPLKSSRAWSKGEQRLRQQAAAMSN